VALATSMVLAETKFRLGSCPGNPKTLTDKDKMRRRAASP
jgi:hypothetical protein